MEYIVSTIISAFSNSLLTSSCSTLKSIISSTLGEDSVLYNTIEILETNPQEFKDREVITNSLESEESLISSDEFIATIKKISNELIDTGRASNNNITQNVDVEGDNAKIVGQITADNVSF